MVARGGAHGVDAAHLDAPEVTGEHGLELRGFVLVQVVGILAVRLEPVRRAEEQHALGREDARDPLEVGARVREVLDHLEARHDVEAARGEGQAFEVAAHEACGRAAHARGGRHAVHADDAPAGAGELGRAVAGAAAEVGGEARPPVGLRQAVGGAVPREVRAVERARVVEPLAARLRGRHASASPSAASAGSANSRAKSAPSTMRTAIMPAERATLQASSSSAGASERNT